MNDAGDDLDQRRLAGAVLAENGVDLPARAREIDVLKRTHAAVALGYSGKNKKIALRRVRHGRSQKEGDERCSGGGRPARRSAGSGVLSPSGGY